MNAPGCPTCRQPIEVMLCVDDEGSYARLMWDKHAFGGPNWCCFDDDGLSFKWRGVDWDHSGDQEMVCGNCHASLPVEWNEYMVEYYEDEMPDLLAPEMSA